MSALYILLICYAFFNNTSEAKVRIQVCRLKSKNEYKLSFASE
eukprot:UN08807